jgi:hypothetical protein
MKSLREQKVGLEKALELLISKSVGVCWVKTLGIHI